MIDSITSGINELLPKCAVFPQLPKLIERAENEFKRLENALTEVKNKKTVDGMDMTEAIKDFEAKVLELKGIIADIKATYKTDPEQAIEDMQAKFFDKLQETWQMYGAIQALYNLQKASVMIVKATAMNDYVIEQLKTLKIDTTKLEELN